MCLDDDDDDSVDNKKNIVKSESAPAGDASVDTEQLAPAVIINVGDESVSVVANVYVYAIAEYYAIPQLKAHALDKLSTRVALMGGWPADGLALALHLATSLGPDGDPLHDLVYAAAVEHAASLVAHPRFDQLLYAGGAFSQLFTGKLAAAARQHADDAAAVRAQLDASRKKHAAEAASLRAQLADAQAKLGAERTRRYLVEGLHRQQLEHCRRCSTCAAQALAGGMAVQGLGPHAGQQQGVGRGGPRAVQQRLGIWRGSHRSYQQLAVGRGGRQPGNGHQTSPLSERGRGRASG